jgi:hypothetical protein
MVIVSGNRRLWWVGMAVSLIIFAVVYFTVIKPDNNTANQAVQAGLKQTQQVITQAQQQASTAAGQASTASGQASTAAATGQKVLNNAAKLTSCLLTAGTDTSKIASCQTQYGS